MVAVDEEALHIHIEDGRRVSQIAQSHSHGTPTEERDRRTNSSVPNAPASANSFRLPLKMNEVQKKQTTPPPPRLLHPIMHRIPMHIRFGINGFLSNLLFMIAYNTAVVHFEGAAPPSTIYSVVYLIFIPITHAMISLLVFGWPERYFPSLMSNTPIGLMAIALGAALTAYLDKIEFNKWMVDLIAKQWKHMGYSEVEPSPEEEKGEFYASLLVLLVTGIWTFVLSVVINSPSEPSEKKEL